MPANTQGDIRLEVGEVIRACDGKFAHLNTLIVKRALYLDAAGMDEHIRYECEWDLYLRVCAAAGVMVFHPDIVARHNVPDPVKNANVSTAMPFLRKMLFRLNVLDKAMMFIAQPDIRRMAERHKIYTLKRIAESLAAEGRFAESRYYASEACIRPFDIKWRAYALYLAARAALSNTSQESA